MEITTEQLVEELNRRIREGKVWIDNGDYAMEVSEATIDEDGDITIVQSNM
jgi:hypothetical protein